MTMTEARSRGLTARAASDAWAVAALLWSVVFAAVHLYWAAGGRRGLGDSADEADAALSTGWFQLYNLSTAALAVGGAVLAAVVLRPGLSERAIRRIGRLAWVASVVLLVRGVLGTVLLIVEAVGRGPSEPRPTLLLLVEPWFVLGGIAFAGVGRLARRRTGK